MSDRPEELSSDGQRADAEHSAERADTCRPPTDHRSPGAPNTETTDHDDERPVEIGGQKGPEPTRYGDWEKNGRCTDF